MKMGRHDKITPDVEEWLMSDDQVVAKWKQIAKRVGLEAYVEKIDQNYTYKKKKFDKEKIKELFDVWRRASPITFTQSKLMDILSKEGLHDMYMWLQLMNTENSRRKSEISYMLDSQMCTPRSAVSLSPQPPNHLLSNNEPLHRSLPTSPYSWYYKQNGTNGINGKDPGILKKRPSSEFSSANSSSDYGNSYYPIVTTLNGSRESTPDSVSRSLSRISIGTERSSHSTKKKTLRFADDLEKIVVNERDEVDHKWDKDITHKPKKVTDHSVEKYFDNLISMIEDAAEGL